MDSDGWRRNKRNILDASGRSNRRWLTPGKRMERRPGRRHEGAVAERSLLTGGIALIVRIGTGNYAPTATRQARRLYPLPEERPIALMPYPLERPSRSGEINSRPKRDRPYRFSACDCRLQLRPSPTSGIPIAGVGQITTQESARPVRRLDQSTSRTQAARYAVAQRETSGLVGIVARTPLITSRKFPADLAENV